MDPRATAATRGPRSSSAPHVCTKLTTNIYNLILNNGTLHLHPANNPSRQIQHENNAHFTHVPLKQCTHTQYTKRNTQAKRKQVCTWYQRRSSLRPLRLRLCDHIRVDFSSVVHGQQTRDYAMPQKAHRSDTLFTFLNQQDSFIRPFPFRSHRAITHPLSITARQRPRHATCQRTLPRLAPPAVQSHSPR